MATERGIAKQALNRAKTAAEHTRDRLAAVRESYKDFDTFALGCEVGAMSAQQLVNHIERLLEELP